MCNGDVQWGRFFLHIFVQKGQIYGQKIKINSILKKNSKYKYNKYLY